MILYFGKVPESSFHQKKEEAMEWIAGLLLMVISFLLVAMLVTLEMAFSTARRSAIMRYELEKGKATPESRTLKALLFKNRMVVVYFVSLLAFAVTLGTPWILRGILPSNDASAASNAAFIAYALVFFVGGELVAKNKGYKHAFAIALFAAPFIDAALRIFFPVAWALQFVYRLSGGEERVQAREEDVVAAALLAQQDGALNPEEARLIARMISVGNRSLGELSIPLSECVAIPLKPTCQQLRDALSQAIAQSQLFICVVEEKTIIGFAERKDITSIAMKFSLKPEDLVDLSELGCVRPTVDLPSHTLVADAVRLLREHRCAVVNESGKGTAGIITLERVVNQILES